MLTMEWQAGTSFSLLQKAIDISLKTGETVRFEFNGVKFEVDGEVGDVSNCLGKMLESVQKGVKSIVKLH
tara:strand:- start:21921 stop:22130 length:210 start_codon:yes stop_codon:yes gene_type:complete